MLSFLNPGFLWALPLAGVPVLLHLIFLRRARKIPFSDLTLLRAAYAQSRPASRLRQWLLLLLRCLLIACLIMVFARPVFHRNHSVGAGKERGFDILLLVDSSWSMNADLRGKSRFDWAVAAGDAMLRLLRPVDRAAVVAFSDAVEGELRWAESPRMAREILGRLRVGERTSDIEPALRAAYAFLAESGSEERRMSGRRKIIAVLSDGAGHLFRGVAADGLNRVEGYDPDVSLLGLKWDEDLENGGLADVRPGPRGAEGSGGGSALLVRTALYGDSRDSWNLDMYLKGRRVDQRSLRMDEGISRPLRFRLPLSRTGELWGRFELRKDSLKTDDVFYFSLRLTPKPRVLLLYGSPNYLEAGSGGYFLKKLLGEGKDLPYRLDLADLGRAGKIRFGDYSVVILADFKSLGDRLPEMLNRYVVRGGGLWVIAGSSAEPQTYAPLSRLLPGRLGEVRESRRGRSALRVVKESLPSGIWSTEFDWSEFELDRVSIGRSYDLELKEDAAVWFRDSSGRPLLVESRFGQGRVLLWASSLDIRWSNLALKPVFTAWMDAGLRHLARYSGRENWRTIRVGEPIRREWGPGEQVPAKVQIRGPGGRRASLLVRDRKVEYAETRLPGIYFLSPTTPNAEIEAYAVNVDRRGPEGDLRPASPAPWSPVRLNSIKADFLRAVYGSEIRNEVLGLVLLFLLLEMFLSRPKTFSAVALMIALCGAGTPASAQEGDRFVWAQLKYTGAWDPYPNVHKEILNFVTTVTSVIVTPDRRMIALKDAALFATPFLVLSGKQAPPELDDEEIGRLRDYLTSGGFLWIEDASGTASSPFNRWVRRTLAKVLPDSDLKSLPSSHVLFKTFFLLRKIGGRVMVSGSVEGVDWAGSTVVVYSRNDLLGAWAKDPLGKFLYKCVPGGEAQRMEARKLTLNIILYALTGSYKADAVHQPFILQKMRQRK